MCFVESDAVPATLDEALSHVQPVLVQDTPNLAGLVTSSANFLRDSWIIFSKLYYLTILHCHILHFLYSVTKDSVAKHNAYVQALFRLHSKLNAISYLVE